MKQDLEVPAPSFSTIFLDRIAQLSETLQILGLLELPKEPASSLVDYQQLWFEAGLERLVSMTGLQVLNVEHEKRHEKFGVNEARFMVQHWPRLKEVLGVTHKKMVQPRKPVVEFFLEHGVTCHNSPG